MSQFIRIISLNPKLVVLALSSKVQRVISIQVDVVRVKKRTFLKLAPKCPFHDAHPGYERRHGRETPRSLLVVLGAPCVNVSTVLGAPCVLWRNKSTFCVSDKVSTVFMMWK